MRFGLLAALLCALLLQPGSLLTRAADEPPNPNVAKTAPRTPAEEQKCFHLPPGFAIELIASEPDIHKPINLNFDERGRLWVTESVEYPYPAPADRKPRDAVKVIQSTRNDGVYDKVSTFADELNIPIGVLPVKNGAIVYSIPNIVRLTDTKGEGKADKREVLYGLYGHNDTHGMTGSFTVGFDGWIYAHHGFSNTSTVKAADGSTIKMQSGNTYRFKPDGSHVEQFTWGQVNPFGLCLDPLGNLYSADCHTRPAYLLLRGGNYPSFGKPHDGLGFAPELMTHDHGSTAICGIVCYHADQFPKDYQNTLFIGNVVTNRINHDTLERHGSTYKAIQQPDFLKCDDPWFRPVDIKLGPDGALYVADFYNRIIGHYEVPLNHPGRDRERGRIWRIVYRGSDGTGKAVSPRADWGKATVDELVKDLGHSNLTVRTIATNQLVERGEKAVPSLKAALAAESAPGQRVHGLWALERLGSLGDEHLATAAQDKDLAVRTHALRVYSERKGLTAAQRKVVREALKDTDGFVQRAAADTLGQHPGADNIRPLLDLRQAVPNDDTHLLYVVRMALRNQLRSRETWAQLPSPLSEGDSRALADVAPGVGSTEAAAFLIKHVQKVPESGSTLTRYVHHAARYAAPELQVELLAFARKDKPADLRHQASLFKAILQGTQERGTALGDDARKWAEEMAGKLLAAPQSDLQTLGIDLAATLKLPAAQDGLIAMSGRRDLKEEQRRAAAAALVAIDAKAHVPFLARLLTDAAEAPGMRDQLATLLAGINQPESRAELVKALPTAPARLQSSIALGLAGSPQGIEQLLQAVTTGKASARLLLERPVELRLSQAKLPELKERVAKLTKGLPAADVKLNELIKQRRTGFLAVKTADLEAGAKIFEKTCANCHQLAGKGAKIGPQLDGIGIRGIDRVLEDILDPNRNVDQAFRATTLSLKNGQFVQGLVLREEGEVIVIADQQGKEVRVTKDQVEERVVSQLSPMPANLADQVPEADFYNLVAFLLAQRVQEKK